MTGKKIYFLFLIVLISCSNTQNDKTDLNFKNYFFQPDWFNEPKIYEYEVTANDTLKYSAFRYFEKSGENKLKHVMYDKDFNMTAIVIYEYLQDKVIFDEIASIEYWNNNKETKEKMTDNVVFEYRKMNEDFGFTHTARIKNESNITKYVTRNLKEMEKREFEGKEVKVVIADGRTRIVIKNDKYPEGLTLINKEKLIYAENIGVIYEESKNQYNHVVSKLTRILNEDEFNKMKNAR